MSLSTGRYQVASITQNNHVYEDLVEYFRSEVLLNLGSQVNVRNALPTTPYLPTIPTPSAILQICHVEYHVQQRAHNASALPIPSSLLNLPAPAAAMNYQWYKERIASVGMYGQRLEYMDGGY